MGAFPSPRPIFLLSGYDNVGPATAGVQTYCEQQNTLCEPTLTQNSNMGKSENWHFDLRLKGGKKLGI